MKTVTDMVGSWLVKFYKLVTIKHFLISFLTELNVLYNNLVKHVCGTIHTGFELCDVQ